MSNLNVRILEDRLNDEGQLVIKFTAQAGPDFYDMPPKWDTEVLDEIAQKMVNQHGICPIDMELKGLADGGDIEGWAVTENWACV